MNRIRYRKNPLRTDDSHIYTAIVSERKTDRDAHYDHDQDQSSTQPQRASVLSTSKTPKPPKKKITFDMDPPEKILDWMKHPDQYTKSLDYISRFMKCSPFQICCIHQPNEVVLHMIETFTAEELNIRNGKMRFSPFMLCCRLRNRFDRTECVLAMIDKFNADELKLGWTIGGGEFGVTPFMYCCRDCPPEIVLRMMERFTADELRVHRHDTAFGYTSFMYCCINQPPEVVLKMIELYSSQELDILQCSFRYKHSSFKICHDTQPQYVVDAFMNKFGRIVQMG